MGLRHIVVVDGELMVVGIVTRADMNEHRLKHYWEEEGEQMQKEMNVDSLPAAVAFDVKAAAHDQNSMGGHFIRRRSQSVQSSGTVDTNDGDIDVEILRNDQEVSDSPVLLLRKKFSV
jgi:hypothetical protein